MAETTPGPVVSSRVAQQVQVSGQPLHVLFCASGDYLQHAAVAAVSLAESCPDAVVVHVFMATADPEAEERLCASLCRYRHVGLRIYHVADRRIASAFTDRYLTQEAYLRFLAADVLAPEIGRVLYLDCDLVVVADPRPLWTADLGGCPVGAVAECDWLAGTTENRLTGLGIPPSHVYVNSGVLLMDLDLWRAEGLADRLFRVIDLNGDALAYHDQDALNCGLAGRIALLDRRWNVQTLMFSRWFRKALPHDHRATEAARRQPGIVHFSTAAKPWTFRAWTRRRRLYLRHLDRTAWRGAAPPGLSRMQRVEHQLARWLLTLGLDVYIARPVVQRLGRRRP